MLEPKLNRELCWDACREELLKVLHTFDKDKSLAVGGRVRKSIYSTFIALIPKQDFPKSLDGFLPISV